jgi:hypothetical protein
MITFKKLLQKPKTFERITGLKIANFLDLVELIREDWDIFEKNKKCSGRNYKIKTLEDKMLCLLIYYRSYINMVFLGMLFDIDDSNVVRLFQKLEKMIAPHFALQKLIKKEIEKDELLELLVDVSETPIQRPSGKSAKKEYFSGKKKKHTVKYEIIRNKKTGKIVSISKIYYGKMHDFKIRKQENKRGNRIPDKHNVQIYVDSGYQGLQKHFQNTIVSLPIKRKKNQDLSTEEKAHNRKNAKTRIPIEHSIGKMKKFKIIAEKYRGNGNIKKFSLRLINIAGLVNLSNGFIG